MRRVVALIALLLILSMSSAFAAGFGAQAEDIDSFTTPVSIAGPQSKFFFLLNQPGDTGTTPPGLLSPTQESDVSRTHSKRIDAGGSLLEPYGTIDQYHAWETAPFPEPLAVVSPTAELLITETGGGNTSQINAGLFECVPSVAPDPPSCTILANSISAIADSGGSVQNITTVTFDSFPEQTIEAGNWIRLVVVSADGSFNIQWGYKANRPASLELTFP